MRPSGSSRIVAVVQAIVLDGLVTWWSLGSSDVTSTSVDASFVATVVATPLLLVAAIGLRWWMVSLDDDAVPPRVVHAVTWLACIVTFLLMPFGVIGAVASDPIG